MTTLEAGGRGTRLTYLRDLTRELVSRELKLRYRGSALGLLWSLLTPLAQLVVFTLLFRGVLKLDVPNYPLFVFVGVLAWNWFQSSMIVAAGAITDNRELVRRPGFPTIVLPAVTVATNFMHYLLALPVLALFVLLSGVTLTPALLLLPALLALQFLLTLGLAYLVSSVNVTFRDTAHLLAVALNLLFYLTPVFYAPESVPERFRLVANLNPLAALLNAQRDVIVEGRVPALAPLVVVAALALALLALGVAVFRRQSGRFAEEL
ncbi:ABC transporter permease [Deinococcus pimensis]|uniref:ABC transporter permease n=1 Tax=Deinococcus pimensis TaxID=309888 RepID=UPI000489D099|nr:ABC transporter permease [Deinococcus pimensis]